MYKNIVFDFGGVMVDFDPKTYLVDRFCNAEVEEQVSQLTFESEEWKLLDAGLISRFDGNHRMLEKARAAGPGLEKERGRRRYSVMGSAETSPVCFCLPIIDS